MPRDPQQQIVQVRRIFNRVAPVYDLLNHVLSLGADLHWRSFTAACIPPGPQGLVLDVACGTGDLALKVAALPHCPRVVGLDLVAAMLEPARKKLAQNPARVELLCGDGAQLPFDGETFDAVTLAFGIRNIPHRDRALREVLRVLIPGGRVYILEFTTPTSTLVRKVYQRYLLRMLPKIGGWISGDQASYQYLAETILEFPSPLEFRKEMARAGFKAPRSHALSQGIAWLHVGEKHQPGAAK